MYSNFIIEFNNLVILNISRLLVFRAKLMLNSGSGNLFALCVMFVMLITLCPRPFRQFMISVVGVEWWWGVVPHGMVGRNGGDKNDILGRFLLDMT